MKNKKVKSLIFILAIVFLRYQFEVKILRSCDDWDKGLQDGTFLLRKEGICDIEKPSICMLDILDGLLDLSFSKCDELNQYKEEGFKNFYFSENTPLYIGIADTTIYQHVITYLKPLHEFFYSKNRGYDTLEQAFENHEQVIDTRNMKLMQKLKYKQQVADERQKITKQLIESGKLDKNRQDQNLVIIYVDAISRQRVLKKLPKTMQFFKEQEDLYEFLRFHSLVGWTDQNAQMFEFGYSYHANQTITNQTKQQSIFDFFKESGYITGKSQNYCEFSYYSKTSQLNAIQPHFKFDHENVAFACDPHYLNINIPHLPNKGPYSIFRHCLYGQDTFEHVLEFGRQFMKTYENQKKLMVLNFIDNHEGTGEVINYLDEPLSKFLREINDQNSQLSKETNENFNQNKKNKNKTTFIFMSDHGWHMNGINLYFSGYQGELEKYLPALFIANTNKLLGKNEQDRLEYNQQKLVSHRELHYFWKYWATGEHYGQSLVSKLPSDFEQCKSISFNCQCANFEDRKLFSNFFQ